MNLQEGTPLNALSIFFAVALSALFAYGCSRGRSEMPFTRFAELEIDPSQLAGYQAAVKEEMEISVRDEPGVLAIYAVADKDNPAKLRFFEIYADEAAFHAHIASAHFRKYVETTKTMIRSRALVDTVPLQLSDKEARYGAR